MAIFTRENRMKLLFRTLTNLFPGMLSRNLTNLFVRNALTTHLQPFLGSLPRNLTHLFKECSHVPPQTLFQECSHGTSPAFLLGVLSRNFIDILLGLLPRNLTNLFVRSALTKPHQPFCECKRNLLLGLKTTNKETGTGS